MQTLDLLTDLKAMYKARSQELEKRVGDLEKENKGLKTEIQRLNEKAPKLKEVK